MQLSDLEKYCEKAIQAGATHAKVTHPSTVVTAPWVRFKCLFGCPYKHRYSCPPHTPSRRRRRPSSILTGGPSCFMSRPLTQKSAPGT